MRRLLLPITLSALICTPAVAKSGPAEVVTDFYTAHLADGGTGAPSGRQLATYSSYLGPELVCTLGASIRYEDRFSQAHPDNSTEVFPNDLFSSSTTVPSTFTLGTASQSGGLTTVPVHFSLKGDDAAGTREWDDTIKLKLVRNHWLIVDVDYTGKLDGGNQGSLLATLRDSLHKAPEIAGWSVRELDSCIMDSVPAKGSSARAHGKSRHTKNSLHGKKSTGKSKSAASPKKSSGKAAKTTTSKKSSAAKTSKTHKKK